MPVRMSRHLRLVAVCLVVSLPMVAGCRMSGIQSTQQPADLADEDSAGQSSGQPDGVAPVPAADVPTLAIADAGAAENDGVLRFTVSLSAASADLVTALYATEDDTAHAGADYEAAVGTLTFAAESITPRHIDVRLLDDTVSESAETFIIQLSDPRGATLAVAMATGTIADNDGPPTMTIANSSAQESDGIMSFPVTLTPASRTTVTVRYATAEGTATADADYASTNGTLTFRAGDTTRAIEVPLLDDADAELNETFTLTLGAPMHARLPIPMATGTIIDDAGDAQVDPSVPLQLTSLAVTVGADAIYPAFDPEVLHYALRCDESTTVRVQAQAVPSATSIKFNRAALQPPSIDETVVVDGDHDIAIELSDDMDSLTYVIHCIPPTFPVVRVKIKEPEVSEGLLFMTPRYSDRNGRFSFLAIIDNNGVPRFHRKIARHANKLQRHTHRPNGASYSYITASGNTAKLVLLDERFDRLRAVETVSPLTDTDTHDYLITGDDTYLFISYDPATRDFRPFQGPEEHDVLDGVIQEVTSQGQQAYIWNSFNHLKIHPDCRVGGFSDYAHLNSLDLVDGDIVASFRGCNQVLRIARSEKTATDPGTRVIWQVGGTRPPRDPETVYLEIVGDTKGGEICGQHSARITRSGNLVLFDNGVNCLGPRKDKDPFSRVVEYEIDVAGGAARFQRQFKLPARYGYTAGRGSVTVLENGHWLIAWNNNDDVDPSLEIDEASVTLSEVDTSGNTVREVFRMNMYSPDARAGDPPNDWAVWVGHSFRVPEDDVHIPLNLP